MALGYQALLNNTTGSQNSAAGVFALYSNTSGSNNTALGISSLSLNTTGYSNVEVGANSIYSNTTGSNNTALGDSSGYQNSGSGNLFVGKKAGYNETAASNKLYIGNDAAATILYGDFSTGQLLIGRNNPLGYSFVGNRKLNVIGGTLTDSLRVALVADWADYVFDKKYPLRSLNELEQYIQQYGHLPNIPTKEEVKQQGINVAEMDQKLLEKIEELTLYIVQQQKVIEEQKQKLQQQDALYIEQHNRIDAMQKQLNTLLSLIKK